MTDRAAEDAFVQRVRDAAEQLWLMRSWEYDQSLEEEGWTTFYAVDADVFRTYGSIETNAQRTKDRPGYSEVFSDDPPAGSYALAERLVDHVFFSLQPNSPLLVIPPIDSEIRSILDALTASLGREPSPATVDQETIKSIISEISEIDIDEPIPTEILGRFSTLVALRGSNPRTEYRRLTNLLLLRRIVPSHSITPQDGYPHDVRAILMSKDTISDIYEHAVLSNEWLERLDDKSSKRASTYRQQKLIRDAYSLARLEIWNQRLSKLKARIVYVTGAPNILNAGLRYHVENTNFLSSYIRHPRYFLASPKVVVRSDSDHESETRKSSQFFEWIVTFLADCRLDETAHYESIRSFQIDDRFERAAKVAFRRDNNLGFDLRTKWRTYLDNISASYVPPEKILEQIKSDLSVGQEIRALEDWSAFRSLIDARIEEENDRAWDDCFRTATRAGLFVGYATGTGKGEPPSRLVPPLRFDRWPRTEEFVRFMGEWRDPKVDIVAQYEARLSEVKQETGEDFQYAYYLAHAALFAARGDWRIGAILAIRAIGKATHPEPENGTTGHGREACYLAAYCLRHRARTDLDLDESEAYLNRAIQIHEKELAKKPGLLALPERFESEKLALVMTKLLRRRYAIGEADNSAPTDQEWAELRDSYANLESRVSAKANMETYGGNARLMECRSRLIARIDANIIMLSILIDDFNSGVFRNSGERLNLIIASADKGRSYYLETIDLFWRATTGRNPPKRTEVRSHFDQARVAAHTILPYDRLRYKELGEKLERLIRANR